MKILKRIISIACAVAVLMDMCCVGSSFGKRSGHAYRGRKDFFFDKKLQR